MWEILGFAMTEAAMGGARVIKQVRQNAASWRETAVKGGSARVVSDIKCRCWGVGAWSVVGGEWTHLVPLIGS